MNLEKYNNGEGDLFVIMRTVTNSVPYVTLGDGPNRYSFLNIRGAFEPLGTIELPIFTWNDRQSAEAALAFMAKKLSSDKVFSINESGCYLGINFTGFCREHELALTKYLDIRPFMNAKARRLNQEKIIKKIFFHASKILEVADAKDDDDMLIIQKRINSENPGWSISSAVRSLLGGKSMELIEKMQSRKIEIIEKLTIEQLEQLGKLEQAITIAKKFLK